FAYLQSLGQEVYSTVCNGEGWDGRIDGKPQETSGGNDRSTCLVASAPVLVALSTPMLKLIFVMAGMLVPIRMVSEAVSAASIRRGSSGRVCISPLEPVTRIAET